MNEDRAGDPLVVEMWADFVCPFCYMGERKLKAGIALHEGPVKIVYRSFQLRPDLPLDADLNLIEMMAQRRNLPLVQVREMFAGATAQGDALGIKLNFERARATNTRRAHELAHQARSQDREAAMIERIFKAYFTDGLLISDPASLVELAADIGLDRAEAARALAGERFLPAVKADIAAASKAGISSVPHFLINGVIAVSGGQPAEVFADALARARAEVPKVATPQA